MIRNGRAFTPAGLKEIDIWIKDGRVAALGGPHRARESIDARGMLVLPGAIDAHVHFRDPGPTYKECWESGSASAACGGVTTVIDQPNTDPRTLDARSFQLKLDAARHGSLVDFCLNGGPGRIRELVSAGASAIGEIFSYEHSYRDLEGILEEVQNVGALATIHAEDGEVLREMSERLQGRDDPEVHSLARPVLAEVRALERVLEGRQRIHICHLSTAQGLSTVEAARRRGRSVSCEVAPHHLLFDIRDYRVQGSLLKTNPPVRAREDCDALWAGLRDGSVDILASDHAPHLPEEKRQGIWDAPSGVPGVETMIPLMLMAVRRNMLSLERLVDATSRRPARIFGLPHKGSIDLEKDADLAIFDTRAISRVRADRLHSRAEWTPYEGREAIFPVMTLLRGEVIFDGDLAGVPGTGRLQRKDFMRTGTCSRS
ncbi:MAG: dihydroorotase [Methanothrix sp.]|nr:dihydroorotase [Methanothrix sp.]